MKKPVGKVIKLGGLNVWPHEQVMADILATVGHTVEFLRPANREGDYTPDALIDGEKWEFKAPKGAKIDAIERNLKRGSRQSERIVLSSHRMKKIPDRAIERELTKQLQKSKRISAIKFINRHKKIIDISE